MVDRRTLLGGMMAAGALLAAPSARSAAPSGAKAPRLQQGDTVGLIAPAGFVADRFGIEGIISTIEAMGLAAKAAPGLLDRDGYLAGSDRERAAAINATYADPQVRAVFAVRGGWGSQRLLPYLDYDLIRANPKLLVGSSDVSALHLALARHGAVPSIHGPNGAHSWPQSAWAAFRTLAFDAGTPTYSVPSLGGSGLAAGRPNIHTFRPGIARGQLLGGNLSVLAAMVGTPYLPDFNGAILFLEDVNEAEYRIDRLLTQLGQSGILKSVAGIVFGQCTNCRNPGSPYGNFTLYEVLDHHFRPLGVPAFQGLSFGHIANHLSIPVGVSAEIDAEAGTLRVLEPAVE